MGPENALIDSGLVGSLGGVPREQKVFEGQLPRVIYHQVYSYTKIIFLSLSSERKHIGTPTESVEQLGGVETWEGARGSVRVCGGGWRERVCVCERERGHQVQERLVDLQGG